MWPLGLTAKTPLADASHSAAKPDRRRHQVVRPASPTAPWSNRFTESGRKPGSPCTEGDHARRCGMQGIPENKATWTAWHRVAATGVDGNRTHQAPRKRRLNGFEGRGTHQVSGHSRGKCTASGHRINRRPQTQLVSRVRSAPERKTATLAGAPRRTTGAPTHRWRPGIDHTARIASLAFRFGEPVGTGR